MFESILFLWIIWALDYYYDLHYCMKIILMSERSIFFVLFHLLLIFFTCTSKFCTSKFCSWLLSQYFFSMNGSCNIANFENCMWMRFIILDKAV